MPRKITKRQSDDLYRLIHFIDNILTENKIRYWITGGTLLGAVRHSGLIPWDDDGDICILKEDEPKLRKLVKKLDKMGYGLESSEKGVWYIDNYYTDLGVDIFVMEKLKTKTTYVGAWRYDISGGINCYFINNHLFPLKRVKFGNFYVSAPNSSIRHLNTCYGNNWNSHIKLLYNHRTGTWGKSKPVKMKANDYLRIPAPLDTKSSPKPIQKKKRSSNKKKEKN